MMRAAQRVRSVTAASVLRIRVFGPESPVLSSSDLRRLFIGRSLSGARRDRIAASTKVVASYGGRVIGVAAYQRAGDELRVSDLAVEPSLSFSLHDILRQLLDAIEMACLAGGCARLVLLPGAVVATTALERLGYELVSEGCAGGWLEKRFS